MQINFSPCNDLRLIDKAGGLWEAEGIDPQFALDLEGAAPLAQGHYFLDILVGRDNLAGLHRPQLFMDAGWGFAETLSVPLAFHEIGRSRFRSYFFLTHPTFALRFDPTIGRGRFSLRKITLTKANRLRWYLSIAESLRRRPRIDRIGVLSDAARLWTVAKNDGLSAAAALMRHYATLENKTLAQSAVEETIHPSHIVPNNNSREINPYLEIYKAAAAAAEGYRHPDFAADKGFVTESSRCAIKVVAYYLPQFHAFKENDNWWGKGFTEWTNVTKAAPRFVGHYQPKLPSDLGFYDLRLPQTMRDQAELAKRFGISAFCFHFYWFGGKRLMEMPLKNFLKSPEIDIDFCLCWANENWTRRWDGAEHEMLIGQNHSPEDDRNFLEYVAKYFRDSRYIKIEGKPVLLVYRAAILPDPLGTTQRWRQLAKEIGFPDIYLVATTSFQFTDYKTFGFDALVEFPPHAIYSNQIINQVDLIDDRFRGAVFSYEAVVKMQQKRTDYPEGRVFPCVMPGWDNTARRPLASNIFHGATPSLYREWLEFCFERAKRNSSGEQFVFVNAWNEWAEGAYLEPDRLYGHAYLWATASVIEAYSKKLTDERDRVAAHNKSFSPSASYAIAAHLFYPELAKELHDSIPENAKIDIYITAPETINRTSLDKIFDLFPNSMIRLVPNVGRDIMPFLVALHDITKHRYEWVCKIHTKKSPQLTDGSRWRHQVFNELLSGGLRQSRQTRDIFRNKNVGLIGLGGTISSLDDEWVRGNTEALILDCADRLGIEVDWAKENYIVGTMFWFRPAAVAPLVAAGFTKEDFGVELGRIDGTLAHAIERFLGILARHEGFQIAEMPATTIGIKTHRTKGQVLTQ